MMSGIYLGFMFGLVVGVLFTQATYYNQDRKIVKSQQVEIEEFSEIMHYNMTIADNEINRLINENKKLEKKLDREKARRTLK